MSAARRIWRRLMFKLRTVDRYAVWFRGERAIYQSEAVSFRRAAEGAFYLRMGDGEPLYRTVATVKNMRTLAERRVRVDVRARCTILR